MIAKLLFFYHIAKFRTEKLTHITPIIITLKNNIRVFFVN